jgi:hypothetical protein
MPRPNGRRKNEDAFAHATRKHRGASDVNQVPLEVLRKPIHTSPRARDHHQSMSRMTHEDALETLASERYLLGDMSELERHLFEDHYFCCAECAADVRDGALMRDAAMLFPATPLDKRSRQ